MSTSTQDRKTVAFGIVTAWFAAVIFLFTGYQAARQIAQLDNWVALQSATFSVLLASLTLIAGIGWAARTRHFVSNIDGSKPVCGSDLDIVLRFVTNTTEQLLLFSIACVGMAIFAPQLAITLLPVCAVWFVVARIAFYFGYRRAPLARAFGFAGTFHPTIALILYSMWAAVF